MSARYLQIVAVIEQGLGTVELGRSDVIVGGNRLHDECTSGVDNRMSHRVRGNILIICEFMHLISDCAYFGVVVPIME